jgi:hypothetical protein
MGEPRFLENVQLFLKRAASKLDIRAGRKESARARSRSGHETCVSSRIAFPELGLFIEAR